MSLTSGFFPSDNGDRRYSAAQFSNMFDGIILDGVFENVGDKFKITANDYNVIVGTGRAWFNHTWTYNDAEYELELPVSDLLLPRIDAVVLEVRLEDRQNTINVIQGTPASNPTRPSMEYDNDNTVYQYPLAYIYRKEDSDTISQSDITYVVGTSECPIVTGPLQVMNISSYVAQFESMFMDWFEVIKGQIGSDLGTTLQNQVATIRGTIERMQTELDAYSSDLESMYSDIEALNTKLAGKANSSHGTHVTYETAKPKANYSTGVVGTSANVSRGDHQHPVDTTRAEAHGYGTTDPGAGSSLATGKLYLVYE